MYKRKEINFTLDVLRLSRVLVFSYSASHIIVVDHEKLVKNEES